MLMPAESIPAARQARDHFFRRIFTVAKNAVRVQILHHQYHIQFLNQFIRASHSRETSSPDA